MKQNTLHKNLNYFSDKLLPYSSSLPNQINSIFQLKRDFEAELNRIDANEQRLSIGIMGQVKAGKSSFLNALLFDGMPILPEAATKKTANLTRISHGDPPPLVVQYYTTDEWAEIVEHAASEGDGARARVARDLIEMVNSHGIDAQATISKQREEYSAASVDELMGRLNDFVGENGKYTALVKFTEIQLPLDDLRGFEIIDTPGMYDPVPSRTQKTRDYMAECDVVFFLSRCSQFLDQSDMDLLAQQLPAKGVKRMVLVAGQLDGVIADDGNDRSSLAKTEKNVRTRISRRADLEMEKLADIRSKLGDSKIAELIRSLKSPIFSSTFAHGYAHWNRDRWGKSMLHMHEQLTDMANSQWNSYQFSTEDWQRLGNFPALENAYQEARQDKQVLLQARRDDLVPRNQAQLGANIDELRQAAELRIAQLKTSDIQTIEASAKACQAKISGISNRLADTINEVIGQARHTVSEVKGEIQRETESAGQVRTRTGQKKETNSYTIREERGLRNLYGLLGRSEETIEETYYVDYEYIAVSDVIERLVSYAKESASNLSRTFNNVVSMSALRADLKRTLIEELSANSEDFDPSAFRSTLESTLSHLSLPSIELDLSDCGELISSQFSGKAKSEKKMAALREKLREALNIVFQQLANAADDATKKLIVSLENTRDTLEEKLTHSIQSELDQLKKSFANKKVEVEKYQVLVEICKSNSSNITP